MFDIEELNQQRKEELRESLKNVAAEVEWVKKTPNEIWSKQQADFPKSYIDAKNKMWRERRKFDPDCKWY